MGKKLKFIAIALYIFSSVTIANDFVCKVDNSIMEVIATVEKHSKRDAGYEYLISFNNSEDAQNIKRILGSAIFLDNRTIDCKNLDLCTKITEYLVKWKKIKNLDLGAYQINYIYHPMKIQSYFSFEDSYKKACSIVQKLIEKFGYDWKTIARYHSATTKHNYLYLKKISQITKRREECLVKK